MLFRYLFVLGLFIICYYLCIGDIAVQFKFYFTMSKGNMMLGYASGKVGSLVFARRMGEQITRPYNGSPKNPKTRSQMVRRIKWANLVNMWRLMKPFISMGMQGRKTTQSDYNKFVGLNVNQSEAYLLKDEARQGATLLAPYIITSGTLGLRTMANSSVTEISLGSVTSVVSTSIGQVSAAIIENNAGFQVGDQITVFALGQTLVDGLPQVVPAAFKFILTDADVPNAFISAVESVGAVSPAIQQGKLAYSFNGVEYSATAGAVVQSRISPNGQLLVSDSRLAVQYLVGGIEQSQNPFAASQSEVLASYGYTPDAFLSPSSAESLPIVATITSVSVDGQAVTNGSSVSTSNDTASVVIIGTNFDKAAPVARFDGNLLQVTVDSPTTATCSFEVVQGAQRPLEVTVGSSSYTITVIA